MAQLNTVVFLPSTVVAFFTEYTFLCCCLFANYSCCFFFVVVVAFLPSTLFLFVGLFFVCFCKSLRTDHELMLL